MRPRTIPMQLDNAILSYVVKMGPSFTCGPITRSYAPQTCKVQFCFSNKTNEFWSVEANVKNTVRTNSTAEVEKLEDDLYDEAVLQFHIKLSEVNGDPKETSRLLVYDEQSRKLR